ncbi:MAG TPA: DUF2939 domain-containing protein [Hyphomicrobiaceae bacterium]|nr:DUF2939 domain-containing protein [Hyphomicrobiaceae bacterium]
MRKLLALIILGAIGFYVAWPAWSGYRIASALQAKDQATLASKIDFPSVRESLRPAVTKEVDARMKQQLAGTGGAGQLLGGDLGKQLMSRIVDQVLATLVTPENVIRIAGDGAGVASAVQKIVMEQVGKAGGGLGGVISGAGGSSGNNIGGVIGNVLGGAGSGGIPGLPGGLPGIPGLGGAGAPAQAPTPAAKPAATPAAPPATPPSFGLGNIKGFGFDGPLGFSVSLARDANQAKSDVTAGMAFKDLDWKLVRLVPTP